MIPKLNKERGIWVAKKAVEMLHSKKPPFDKEETIPEMILPEGVEPDSLEQALFLFYAVSMDSLRNADDLYKSVRGMVREAGAWDILCMEEKELEGLIDKYMGLGASGSGGPDDPLKTLMTNNNPLLRKYKGDPRNIFKGVSDIDEMIRRLVEFRQFGPGKSALLLKNYYKLGFIELEDPYDFPIKVDRHVIRISVGTGVMRFEPEGRYRTEKIVPMLRELYRKITRAEKIDPGELDDALWVIGAKICVKKKLSYCQTMQCPLEHYCEKLAKMHKKGSYIDPRINMREETPGLFR